MLGWFGCLVTALHLACWNNASIEIILKLIEVGGRELVMKNDNDGYTALHLACLRNASIEIILKLMLQFCQTFLSDNVVKSRKPKKSYL